MTCPKCISEEQKGNFCSNCANPLKEKCSECGEMETINRKMCKKRFNEAENEFWKYYNKAFNPIFFLACISLTVSWIFAWVMICFYPWERWGLTLPFYFPVYLFIFGLICYFTISFYACRAAKKQEIKFFQKFPKYAEILKKAKSADAESFGGQGEEEK